jgi:hypothetical protein
MSDLGVNPTVYLPVNVIAGPAPTPHSPSNDGRLSTPYDTGQFGAPLQDPRGHPATRIAGEGLVTAGRGQAPNAATFAGMQR